MRRTLDQYYYSYLADTKTRDGDQVAMRARHGSCKKRLNSQHNMLLLRLRKMPRRKRRDPSRKLEKKGKNGLHQMKDPEPKPDGNSPVVVIDQLWLWVVSPGSTPFLAFGDIS